VPEPRREPFGSEGVEAGEHCYYSKVQIRIAEYDAGCAT